MCVAPGATHIFLQKGHIDYEILDLIHSCLDHSFPVMSVSAVTPGCASGIFPVKNNDTRASTASVAIAESKAATRASLFSFTTASVTSALTPAIRQCRLKIRVGDKRHTGGELYA